MKPQSPQEKFSGQSFKNISKDVAKKEPMSKASKAFVDYGIGSATRMINTRISNRWE